MNKSLILTVHKAVDEFADLHYIAQLRRTVDKNGINNALARATDFTDSEDGRSTGGLLRTVTVGQGIRIMLLKNLLVTDGLCNGSLGTIVHVVPEQKKRFPITVWVVFDCLQKGKLPGDAWRKMELNKYKILSKQITDYKIPADACPILPTEVNFKGKGTNTEIKRTQLPLAVAFSATIHKVV